MKISIILILVSQLLIAYSQYLIGRRIKDMPENMAWECNKVAEAEKRMAKKWRDKYIEVANENYRLKEEQLDIIREEICEGKN